MIVISFIFICIMIVIAFYFLALRYEGKVINVMVPYIIISLPTLYIFECFYLYLTGEPNSFLNIYFFICVTLYIYLFSLVGIFLHKTRK